MGVTINYLAHHIRVLRDCGYMELIDTAQRRGATEHFYRATEAANVTREISKLLPKSMREGITAEMIYAIVGRITAAIEADTFDSRDERHVSWMPMTLDEQGWQALVDLKARALGEELEIESEAHERMAGSGAPGITATAVNMPFRVAPARRIASVPRLQLS